MLGNQKGGLPHCLIGVLHLTVQFRENEKMLVKGSWERAWIYGRALPAAAAAVLRSVVSKSKYVWWHLQFGRQERGFSTAWW